MLCEYCGDQVSNGDSIAHIEIVLVHQACAEGARTNRFVASPWVCHAPCLNKVLIMAWTSRLMPREVSFDFTFLKSVTDVTRAATTVSSMSPPLNPAVRIRQRNRAVCVKCLAPVGKHRFGVVLLGGWLLLAEAVASNMPGSLYQRLDA